jgi:hypothetical protein
MANTADVVQPITANRAVRFGKKAATVAVTMINPLQSVQRDVTRFMVRQQRAPPKDQPVSVRAACRDKVHGQTTACPTQGSTRFSVATR